MTTVKIMTFTTHLSLYVLIQTATNFLTDAAYNPETRVYTLTNNGSITAIPPDIPPDALIVDLKTNGITNCQTLPRSTSIYKVILKYNMLSEFPDLRAIKANLSYLDLESNRISVVTSELLSALANLQELLLSYNQLSCLPDIAMPKLHLLYLSGNEPMTDLPFLPVLGQTIKELTVGHPAMPGISVRSLRAMPRLVYLNIAYGSQTSVPPVTEANPLLEQLILEHNRISHLPEDIFTKLKKLRILSVGDNLLETFPDPCEAAYFYVSVR